MPNLPRPTRSAVWLAPVRSKERLGRCDRLAGSVSGTVARRETDHLRIGPPSQGTSTDRAVSAWILFSDVPSYVTLVARVVQP